MARAGEEDEVAGPEPPARDAMSTPQVPPARVRQRDAEVAVDEADEPRAVEAGARGAPAPAVPNTQEVARIGGDALAESPTLLRRRGHQVPRHRHEARHELDGVSFLLLGRAIRASLERAYQRQHESEGDGEQQYEKADWPHGNW